MSVVVEANGAQVLPDLRDQRATRNGWLASVCIDADWRRTHPIWAELAASLFVMKEGE